MYEQHRERMKSQPACGTKGIAEISPVGCLSDAMRMPDIFEMQAGTGMGDASK